MKLISAINKLVKTNNKYYNESKLLEELIELSEILIKGLNKKGSIKEPPMDKYIEEIGDVKLRIMVIEKQFDIEGQVHERIKEKAKYIEGLRKKSKYKGKL